MALALAFVLVPSIASAAGYSLATRLGNTSLQCIPGDSCLGEILFCNVDGTETTFITMETIQTPDGWTIEFLPGTSTQPVILGGSTIDVEQNLYMEPTPVWAEENPAPEGQHPLELPNRLGTGVFGYTWAKQMLVQITVPDSVNIGEREQVTVNAVASYLGQTGAIIIGQERPFTFTVSTVSEYTDPQIVIPFDWDRWLPVIIAGGIGVAVVGVVYIPRLIAKRRKSA